MSFTHHTGRYIKTAILFFILLLNIFAGAQQSSFNFHHLSTANGLSDPAVRSIAQDKYGYIWVSTVNGLNRYNSYDIKIYQHKLNDSLSLPSNYASALLTDNAGNLWAAFQKGIYKYDYNSGRFSLQAGSKDIATNKMIQDKGNIYLSTRQGLAVFNTGNAVFTFLKNIVNDNLSQILLSKPVNDFCIRNDAIYIATDMGLILYNTLSHLAERKTLAPVKDTAIERVAVDALKNIWVTYGANGSWLLKTDATFSTYIIYTDFTSKNNLADNSIVSIFTDNKGRVWLATGRSGISLYNPTTGKFIIYEHDPLQPMSISENLTTVLYQDKQGFIWVGTEGNGINYFHPDDTFFHSIQPSYNQSPTLPDYWCRAAAEDKEGNLWLATASGIAKYDPRQNRYTLFQHTKDKNNSLQYNSVRSVLCDSDWVWIGTGNGLNRYNTVTGKMEAWGEKDSVPVSFFWTIIKDHEKNIWFGCRNGIYKYNHTTGKIESVINDLHLAKYAAYNTLSLFEDSHQRIWFGFYSKGLLRYDPAKKDTKYWTGSDTGTTSLSDGHVTSISEDKTGTVWIATLEGLNSCNAADRFTQYLRGNGLVSERTAALIVDNSNRLWMAAGRGLCMLDASRKFFKYFDISDGLPSMDFNTQSAYKMYNGDVIYPTLKGFVVFNPANYVEKNNSINVYVSSFNIFEKEFISSPGIEQMNDIRLDHNQNFFSLEITAINYINPRHNWYAYKLVPFDKDWVYTKERLVNYTNVPGGDYTFHYKTSTGPEKWNVPEKTIHIYIATVFYRTWWFRLIVALMIISILYWTYTYRIAQKERMLMLEKKAYSLEKEKALVMYESLKQQLNPHFLFNSLTSLSSLISSNPANAKQFLERMSKIYRYILKSRDTETVPLGDELKLAEIYAQLQQTRFKEGLQLNIDVPEEYLHYKVAPVTLQNLVENAIKHNIIDVGAPLVVRIFVEDGWITVQNNLQKKTFVESSNKQGLANMQSLYYYLSGKQIIIKEEANYFTIKLPLL